jgi:hypothetical protein
MSSDNKEKPDNPFDFLTNSVLELFERLVIIQNSRSDNEKELWQFSSDFSTGLPL